MRALLVVLLAVNGCTKTSPAERDGATAAADARAATEGTGADVPGAPLISKLLGLWSGAATMTPLGNFPLMNMDMRPVTDRIVFGRVDLDEKNSLRFAVQIEEREGKRELVYRNGGLFRGLMRDTRTRAVSYDAKTSRWRFCDVAQGCSYIDATFELRDSGKRVRLDVKVRGRQHVTWDARKLEARTAPGAFPRDLTAVGKGTEPFAPMPSLKLTASWSKALVADANVYVVLTVTDCVLGAKCNISRSLIHAAKKGAKQAVVTIDQLHAGAYKLNVLLDRDKNLVPAKGDAFAIPNIPLTVGAKGETKHAVPLIDL